jgi:two-component system sensor histidine kinase RegB
MSSLPTFDRPQHAPRNMRLDTLVRLRWASIAGQTIVVLVVDYGLDFDLPEWWCLAIVAVSAWLNIALRVRFRTTQRLEPNRAAWVLAFDIGELAALLFLTGGLQNPFAFLLLAPVLLAAVALPRHMTLLLGGFAITCATVLVFAHFQLPWESDEPLLLPPLYIMGVWLSLLLAIGFIGVYTWQISEESRQLADALAATELVLAREQHLSQLDGLAAAAAHELGTPLATIAVVAKELERAIPPTSPHFEDVRLLREQAQRCRDILSKITQLSASGAPFDRMPLSTLIEEVVAPHRDFGVAIKVRIAVAGTPQPVGTRNPAILYGVGNILENAVDFARSTVEVNAWWNTETVEIVISDDGPGIAPDMLKRIGEPYLSRRRSADEAHAGLGLGVFIARTLLERTGAKVSFTNRTFPDHGAVVQIAWPRSRFETSESTAEPAS